MRRQALSRPLPIASFLIAVLLPAAAGAQPPVPVPTTQRPAAKPAAPPAPTMAEVIANSKPEDWRALDPENVLYLDMAGGRVVIELAPEFAPKHVKNIKVLARQKYFDGLAFLRSQDNYVVQWGDPSEGGKALGEARKNLMAELARPMDGVAFTQLADGDVYAPEVGFSRGLPMARDPQIEMAWLAHCYGMVGVGRGDELDSGNGAEIYVVIGHSPRHLDRNVTLVGRVLQGMDLLSVLPRGKGNLGFYEKPEQHVPIQRIQVAADVPEKDRVALEALRTDTPTFEALVASRRSRHESWFKNPVGHIELCNVPLPVRPIAPKPAGG